MGRVKNKELLDGDGWTIVGGSGRGNQEAVKPSPRTTPSKTVDGLTADKLQAEFNAMKKLWRQTTSANFLEKTLGLRDWSVTEAVCIGIGSFSFDWEHRYRSMWQLVLFMATVDLLQHDKPTVTLYAQEPVFTPLDTAFLNALNVTVLPTGIESIITTSSFVFAPFLEWFKLLPVFLKDKDPELYIGSDILSDYSPFAYAHREVLAECNELGRKFGKSREKRRVPTFELHAHALKGLMLYWREEDDQDE